MINDAEFKELLGKYCYFHKVGEIVEGQVVGYDNNNAIVDINTKNYALCPNWEILLTKTQNIKDTLCLNEKYEFVIVQNEDEDGIFKLSHKKVALKKNQEILKDIQANNDMVQGAITNIVKGGLIVNVMGIKGFVPTSQLNIVDEKVGDLIQLKILTLDDDNFILSNKKVYQDSQSEIKQEIMEKIELGMVVKGRVVRIADFGAFVDIGGLDGLLPLSQMSWKWVDDPNKILKIDDKIDVEIIGIDEEKQRISLSMKTLQENPWQDAYEATYGKGTIEGKVTKIKPFGAFLEIYPDIEGLISKAQIQQYAKDTKKNIQEGDVLEVVVKEFDVKNQKIVFEIVS